MDYDDDSLDSNGKSDEENTVKTIKDDSDYSEKPLRKCKRLEVKPVFFEWIKFYLNIGSELSVVKKSRQRTKYEVMEEKFVKMFKENEHLFDMTCDSCAATFKTLDEARTHYTKLHKNKKGYIKCCSTKLTYRSEVIRHLQKHLEPKNFK